MSDVPAGTKKAVDFDAVQAIKEAWETSPPRRKVRVYIGLVDSGRRSVLINPPGSLDSDTCLDIMKRLPGSKIRTIERGHVKEDAPGICVVVPNMHEHAASVFLVYCDMTRLHGWTLESKSDTEAVLSRPAAG